MTTSVRRTLFTAFIAICVAGAGWLVLLYAASPAMRGASGTAQYTVYFSPRGGCTEAIIRTLQSARTEVLVQDYSFTSAPIAKALVSAHKRGVTVRVILDDSQRTANYSEADFLAHMGIATYLDGSHAIAHNKIIIVDRKVIITGSFNFTKSAEERNAENLLILRDPSLAGQYLANFRQHLAHAKRYRGR